MTPSNTPFDRISIALSGAGYRAAAFHLGSMAYLDRLQFRGCSLLQNVRVLSSVSGGSFVNAMYTTTILNHGDFRQCFDRLYRLMTKVDMVDEGLKKLAERKWPGFKEKKLTNALAEVYHEHFFRDRFEIYWQDNTSHLDEVIFNTADLSNRRAFRFQKTSQDKGHFGNHYAPTPLSVAKEIRLADVVAASTSFPGGFEPLMFPNDFQHTDSPNLDQWAESLKYSSAGHYPLRLMDGSVGEDQGINSVIHAERRSREQDGVNKENPKNNSLLIVSDVSALGIGAKGIIPSRVSRRKRINIFSEKTSCVQKKIRAVFQPLKKVAGVQDRSCPPGSIFSNTVYELGQDSLRGEEMASDILRINDNLFEHSVPMQRVSDVAASMGATLWFTPGELKGNQNKLDSLVVCGNFNICYHLLRYVDKLYRQVSHATDEDQKYKEDLKAFHFQLAEDWNTFKKDPYWLLTTLW